MLSKKKKKRERERKGKKNITSAGNLSAILLNEGVLCPWTASVPQGLLQHEWFIVRLKFDTIYFSSTSPNPKPTSSDTQRKKQGYVSTLKEKWLHMTY